MFKSKDKIIEIFNNLEKRGFFKEFTQANFIQEFMRVTDITMEKTCVRYLKVFRDLGYIRVVSIGVLQRCTDLEDPYKFEGDK